MEVAPAIIKTASISCTVAECSAPADALESGSAPPHTEAGAEAAPLSAGAVTCSSVNGASAQNGASGGIWGGQGGAHAGGGGDGEMAPMLSSEMELELHISNDDPLVVLCFGAGCRRFFYYLCCCFCCDLDGAYLDELLIIGGGPGSTPRFARQPNSSACSPKIQPPSIKVHMPLSFKSLRLPRMPSARRAASGERAAGAGNPPHTTTRNHQAAARAARSTQHQRGPRPIKQQLPRQLSDHV